MAAQVLYAISKENSQLKAKIKILEKQVEIYKKELAERDNDKK